MYSFELDAEQKMLVETLNRYAAGALRPAARTAEESGVLPAELVNTGWELGVLQASIPEEFGGFGNRSAVVGVLTAEEMAFGDLAGALAVMTPALWALPILLAGSPEQKQAYLPTLVRAEWRPFTAALIEYAYDFDPNALQTTAVRAGPDYILNGAKAWVPFAQDADAILVYAALDGQTQGFLVPRSAPGCRVQPEREKLLGINALPLYRLELESVSVPGVNRLGGAAGHDFEPLLAAMRLASSGLALGVARAAFEYARDYAKDRQAFGVKIAQKQAIAFMLAEMRTEIEAVRLLTWEAAWKIDQAKEDACTEAYLACTGAADMAMQVTDRAVQILGGHGYIREQPVEMWMRNGRGFAMLTGLAVI